MTGWRPVKQNGDNILNHLKIHFEQIITELKKTLDNRTNAARMSCEYCANVVPMYQFTRIFAITSQCVCNYDILRKCAVDQVPVQCDSN